MMTDRSILDAIAREDPDGFETVIPTPAHYAEFNHWVVDTYGKNALIDYRGFNWSKEYGTYE